MLLNYENKRAIRLREANPVDDPKISEIKTKHRVRNFKLKFSRMTTCFASIAAIGSLAAPVNQQSVIQLIRLTPRERLKLVGARYRGVKPIIGRVLKEYDWFLTMTGLPTAALEAKFADKAGRTKMFERANAYGDLMYELITTIDSAVPQSRLLRTLVI